MPARRHSCAFGELNGWKPTITFGPHEIGGYICRRDYGNGFGGWMDHPG
jgi:hypothetical protein